MTTGEKEQVRWGVLGVARIATNKVIPAMQKGSWTRVDAIASRDGARARDAGSALGIPKAYSSYEDLLADSDIDAVYIPLPNHLHVPWTTRAAEAGKHVLCEKPVALTAADARQLVDVRNRTGVLIQEAFMVRTHPQWLRARDIVRSGRIGPVRSITGTFSYFNDDPANVRNVHAYGGGALFDIGCYLVNTARMIFEDEPRRVCALVDRDPRFGVDRLSSMLLDFPGGQAIGTCATQLAAGQSVMIAGTRGRLEIEIPFNAPPDRPARVFVDSISPGDASREIIEIHPCDQYTIQGDLLSEAIRRRTDAPYPLEDSVKNLQVLEGLFRSAETGRWAEP
ncbi:MAG: Gfo/Idh/MocA family oxidoreductase [Acidobacteriota bacterium]|nr:Gfo/Idh/MocA family oxidoreductase [Acidobacteriota bacterium]